MQIPLFAQDEGDLLKIADEYYENEQYHTAAQYYQVALGLQPDNPERNFRLAQCYRSVFDYTMAANYYRRTMELDEVNFPLAPLYLAQMEKSMGNFKEAKDGFERFIKTNKKSSLVPAQEKSAYIKQAEIEMEGSVWAIEQLGKSWRDIDFRLLPEPVNSVNNDYAAVPATLPGSITITSGRKGARGSLVDNRFGDYFTDNLRFKRQEDDKWVQDQISDHFDRTNTKFSDGVGTYNATGDKYYFTSCYEGNAFCKLYVIYRENGSWRNPALLNENVNAPGYDNKHPTLTAGGDTLIFVSNRLGGPGGNDLWYSVLEQGEDWQPPRPLPGNINTPFNEASPFCHGDNLLFFSSDGHAGIGSMDIFMAENYLGAKSTIQNLGTPFNSGYDDSFFSLGQGTGYLSSNRPGGKGKFDIYGFVLPKESEQDLAQFLQETAEGSHLRSRIRDSDASNLFASRDEDQFYYDNLSANERAKFDRILSAKQSSQGALDLSLLSRDDIKYYHKLDIGTKAIIERLALKKAMDLEGLTAINQMSPMQKLDWEYYQNIDEVEKEVIDRILDVRVEGRRMALSKLDNPERAYSSDPLNKPRIESKVQLRSLNSLANTLNQRQQLGHKKYQKNQKVTRSLAIEDHQYIQSRSESYRRSVDDLGASYSLFYRSLSPEQRDDIHQSALREEVIQHPKVDRSEQEVLLFNIGLAQDPIDLSSYDETGERQKAETLKEAIQNNLNQQMTQSNMSIVGFVEQEIAVQQAMLEQHLKLLGEKESETHQLQQQLEHYLEQQEQAADPLMEEKVVDAFYSQLQELPLLTPKESYYFNALSPGHLLRIERLAAMVDEQTGDMQPITGKEFISDQQATDQWFYLELPPNEQEMVDQLIANGWNLEQSNSPQLSEFVLGLSHLEKERIDRMMGNQNMNLERQAYKKMAHEHGTEPGGIQFTGRTEIYFDVDQHVLRPEAKLELSELKQYLTRKGKAVTLVIEGHADSTGNKSYNRKLAQRRSRSAAKYFKSSDLVKVSIESRGEEQPAYDNQTPIGRQMNRRVELKITGLFYKSSLRTYLIRPDVSLGMITAATGYSEREIISWNGPFGNKLRAYQPLRLPVELTPTKVESVLYLPHESTPVKDQEHLHTVAEGENLFELARMYNTSVQMLEDLNQLSSEDLLPGQKIRVK